MWQFFEAYRDARRLSPLVRVLPWPQNLNSTTRRRPSSRRA